LKILQICFRVPYPPTDGGAIAMFGITQGLANAGHEVTVLAINTPKHFQSDTVLEGIAEKLFTVYVDTKITVLKAFLNLFKTVPYIVERFISKEFEETLIHLLKKDSFDIVHFEGTYVAWYAAIVKRTVNVPVLMRSHNVEYLIWERLSQSVKNPLKKLYFKYMAWELKRFEKKYLNKFDLVAAITPEDAERIKQLGVKTKVQFLPASIDTDKIKPSVNIEAEAKTCFIFSALDWMPNQEAVFWFIERVWDKVVKKIPGVKLHIAGKSTPEKIYALANESIVVHGFVESASVFVQQYDLMLVPLLSGGGMRLKIIEGMALGKVVLSTPVGAEGIGCRDGENILICETPEKWVSTIIDFFVNREKYKEIGKKGRILVESKYSEEVIMSKLIKMYQEITA